MTTERTGVPATGVPATGFFWHERCFWRDRWFATLSPVREVTHAEP